MPRVLHEQRRCLVISERRTAHFWHNAAKIRSLVCCSLTGIVPSLAWAKQVLFHFQIRSVGRGILRVLLRAPRESVPTKSTHIQWQLFAPPPLYNFLWKLFFERHNLLTDIPHSCAPTADCKLLSSKAGQK